MSIDISIFDPTYLATILRDGSLEDHESDEWLAFYRRMTQFSTRMHQPIQEAMWILSDVPEDIVFAQRLMDIVAQEFSDQTRQGRFPLVLFRPVPEPESTANSDSMPEVSVTETPDTIDSTEAGLVGDEVDLSFAGSSEPPKIWVAESMPGPIVPQPTTHKLLRKRR